jgi:hypothetical protein
MEAGVKRVIDGGEDVSGYPRLLRAGERGGSAMEEAGEV